jgi:hypothetical protein
MVLARRPLVAMVVAGWTIAALRRKLHDVPPEESVRLAGVGHLYAGRQVASAITRVWWPLSLVAAFSVRRSRLPLAAAATVPALLDWRDHHGPLDPAVYVALRLADDVAYGTGVWLGSIDQRCVGALTPKFTNWPGRTAG